MFPTLIVLRRLKIILFSLCFLIFLSSIYIAIFIYKSPAYKYVQCAKKKCKPLNVFYSLEPIPFHAGINVVATYLIDNLNKKDDINLYLQSEQHNYNYLFGKIKLSYANILIDRYVAKYSNICFTSWSWYSINPEWFSKNHKSYIVLHDLYNVFDLIKLEERKREEFFLREKSLYWMLNHRDSQFLDVQPMNTPIFLHQHNDGVFSISQTSIDDWHLFAPEFSHIPYHLIHWPLIDNTYIDKRVTKLSTYNKIVKKINKTKNKKVQNIKRLISNNEIKYFISPPKDVYHALKAINKIKKKYKDDKIKLILYGNASGGAGLRNLTDTNILQDLSKILYPNELIETGTIDEEFLNYLMHNALALINIIPYEGYGLPIVHAMSMGLPIVASNSGSISEVLEDGGYLLKNKAGCKLMKYFSKPFLYKGYCEIDEDDLFNVLEKLYLDQKYREEMSQKALKTYNRKVQNGLTWPNLVDKMVNVWKKDLGLI